MADRPVDLRKLRRLLGKYDVWEEKSRGKGSHTLFCRRLPDGVYTYPIPTHSDPVKVCYVKGARKRFRLTAHDGISDDEFYKE